MIHKLKWLAPALVAGVLACSNAGSTAAIAPAFANADSARILTDIAYLAADRLEGRLTGTPGNDSAAAYIARRYEALKLKSPYPGYLQKFVARSAQAAHTGDTAGKATQNVVAMIEGTDPVLKDQYIVIGAHFDHLGRSTVSALDPEAQDAIRNGADDNASGTAAVMELARMFSIKRPARSIIFANFSGEEQGLLGSQYFVDNPPVPLAKIAAMLNFDMVGRMKDNGIMVFGTATATELPALIDSANAGIANPLKVSGSGDGFGSSDHSSFYAKEIPVLHFFTDTHLDYHKATDDVEKINLGGEARVVDLAFRIAQRIDSRPARLSYLKSTAPSRAIGSGQGSQAYLGSVPDMAASETPGLKLTGVRAGSPADVGGLKPGDIIVEFDGKEVKDLYSYSDALYARKPGDSVKIAYLRDGKRNETTVTLGKRGG
jgi:Zn-dependent M28 family amino/carboxypeptidase